MSLCPSTLTRLLTKAVGGIRTHSFLVSNLRYENLAAHSTACSFVLLRVFDSGFDRSSQPKRNLFFEILLVHVLVIVLTTAPVSINHPLLPIRLSDIVLLYRRALPSQPTSFVRYNLGNNKNQTSLLKKLFLDGKAHLRGESSSVLAITELYALLMPSTIHKDGKEYAQTSHANIVHPSVQR